MDLKQHPLVWMILGALAAGFGQLLASGDKLNWRIVVGRALSSSSLALGAGAIMIFYSNIEPIALVGLASLLGNFGSSGLERLAQIVWGKA